MRLFLFSLLLTWVSAWTELVPAGSTPAARAGHQSVFSASDLLVVVFGGKSEETYFHDTWIFFLLTSQWNEWEQTTPTPSARHDHSMSLFNSSSGSFLLFGGLGSSGVLSDCWTFSYSDGWAPLTTKGEIPEKRFGHSQAFDGKSTDCWKFSFLLVGFFGRHNYCLWRVDKQLGSLRQHVSSQHPDFGLVRIVMERNRGLFLKNIHWSLFLKISVSAGSLSSCGPLCFNVRIWHACVWWKNSWPEWKAAVDGRALGVRSCCAHLGTVATRLLLFAFTSSLPCRQSARCSFHCSRWGSGRGGQC